MKETEAQTKERALAIVRALAEKYPSAVCALTWEGDPWRLLVMGRLSAQCTDARVNIVCEDLFRIFPDARSMADAPLEKIESVIRPCGLYHTKAQSLKEASLRLCEVYGGILPDTMEELLTFPGVGRKIANLLLGDVFHKPAVVADTHCIRISSRLGLTPADCRDPEKTEFALIPLIPPEEQSDFCHRLVLFGREICSARAPRCAECPLAHLCPSCSL